MEILPDHGRTASAITPFPVTAGEQKPGGNSPRVEYDFYTNKTGAITLNAFFSPSLNIHNTPEGLQYAISIDGEAPQGFCSPAVTGNGVMADAVLPWSGNIFHLMPLVFTERVK